MLPERDGWSVLAELRRRDTRTPVLFLTARDAIHDRVKGLELGADDYLVKPFAFSELLARMRSLLRRTLTPQPDVVRIADLEVDILRFKALRYGQRLDLTPKEFALLALLAQHTGEVLSRRRLLSRSGHELPVRRTSWTWPCRLRRKVDDPFTPKLIQTVGGGLCPGSALSAARRTKIFHASGRHGPAHRASQCGWGCSCQRVVVLGARQQSHAEDHEFWRTRSTWSAVFYGPS
jgi:two-component system copper resistance phosphate regulon response regulator CusR